MNSLKSCELPMVVDALRANDIADTAEDLNTLYNFVHDGVEGLGVDLDVKKSHDLAQLWNVSGELKDTFAAGYEGHQTHRQERLEAIAGRINGLLFRHKPGLVHVIHKGQLPPKERLTKVEFVPAVPEPYQESTLALLGVHGQLENVRARNIRFNVTKLPKTARHMVGAYLVSQFDNFRKPA